MVLSVTLKTTVLLCAANVLVAFAWYARLRNLAAKPWYFAAVLSWVVACFEYLLQVALAMREHVHRVATVHLLELRTPAFDVRLQASAALSPEVVHDALGVFGIAFGTRKTVLSLAHAARGRLDDPVRCRFERQRGTW